MPKLELPCAFDCGYWASGQDLADHERYEHADCPLCGAKAPDQDDRDGDGFAYSLTHRADCPRLQTGHRYGPEDAPKREG